MAIYINADDCINCGACEPECPNTASYEGGTVWSLGDTKYEESQSPGNFKGNFWQADYYYIVPDKCTECKTFHDEPQCAAVCPVDCCLPDANNVETEQQLISKVAYLDTIDPNRRRN